VEKLVATDFEVSILMRESESEPAFHLDSRIGLAYGVERMPIPEFIKSLRAKIGTDLLQIPTAMVMAYDHQGRLLLVKDMVSGLWGPPSGIIDPHELPADAAVREVWEEAGVFVELTQILGVFAGVHFSGVYSNGDQLSVVATVFGAKVISGTPRADQEETSDARFFHANEFEQLSSYSHFDVIRRAIGSSPSQAYFKPATWRPQNR
jgi:8-oxo-dGTP pyrophosphatase MutT (NUDIX family)